MDGAGVDEDAVYGALALVVAAGLAAVEIGKAGEAGDGSEHERVAEADLRSASALGPSEPKANWENVLRTLPLR